MTSTLVKSFAIAFAIALSSFTFIDKDVSGTFKADLDQSSPAG